MGNWQFGPNHPDYGSAILLPQPFRAPRRKEDKVGEHYTLPQLIREYAREHDQREGQPCACILCADLRWHEAQARGGGR